MNVLDSQVQDACHGLFGKVNEEGRFNGSCTFVQSSTRDVIALVVTAGCTSSTLTTMGLLMSLPLASGLGTIVSSCLAGAAFCCTSTAGKSPTLCDCKPSSQQPQPPCSSSLAIAIPQLPLVLDLQCVLLVVIPPIVLSS